MTCDRTAHTALYTPDIGYKETCTMHRPLPRLSASEGSRTPSPGTYVEIAIPANMHIVHTHNKNCEPVG
jgi:hypothetical protein